MLKEIMTFVTENKEIVLGSAGVFSELVIIIVNLVRKLKQKESKEQKLLESPAATQDVKAFMCHRETTAEVVWWAVNPLNLFKKL